MGFRLTWTAVIDDEFPNSHYRFNNSTWDTTDLFDFVFLKTAPIDRQFAQPGYDPPQAFDRVAVPGLHILLYQADYFTLRQSRPLSDYFRWDDGPACKIRNVAKGCVYYGCNTERSASGAPIFSVDAAAGTVRILGIHTKPDNAPGHCQTQPGLGNVGIVVPTDEIVSALRAAGE